MEEIFGSLGIKPMQIAIQMLGFFLVFGLLAKLLWKPVLDLMDARENEVKDLFDKAENAKKESEQLMAEYKDHLEKIKEEAQEKIAEGIARGNEMGDKIVNDARKMAEQEKQRAINAIEDEATKARMELRDFAVTLSMDIAEKVLQAEVDRSKHENLVKKLVSDLESMN